MTEQETPLTLEQFAAQIAKVEAQLAELKQSISAPTSAPVTAQKAPATAMSNIPVTPAQAWPDCTNLIERQKHEVPRLSSFAPMSPALRQQ